MIQSDKRNLITGFYSLDQEIKGIRRGEIITCQARPGAGRVLPA